MDLLIRQITSPEVDLGYDEPIEMLCPSDARSSCGAYIIWIPYYQYYIVFVVISEITMGSKHGLNKKIFVVGTFQKSIVFC